MDKKSDIVEFFQKVPHVVAVFLFGSQARNTANSQSDVDIAVLFEKTNVPKPLDMIYLRENLADVLKQDVDLVCLNTASPILGMQVHKEGIQLLMKDSRAYAMYQISLVSDYAELKELRALMEKNILKRKYYD